jgi:ABC-type amino acid transport substrate-binding protein
MTAPQTERPPRSRWRRLLLAGVALVGLLGVLFFVFSSGEGLSLLRRDGTWAAMEQSKDFRVGLDPSFPPFESLDENGRPVGFDVDLAQALAERWGLVLKLDAIGYDSLLDAVLAARVDAVISAMPYDERLTRDLAISQPYFEAGMRLAVAAGSPITGTAGLAGRRVAVEWGSAGDMIARRLQRTGSADPDARDLQPLALSILQYDTPIDAMQAVASGVADAVLVDAVSLRLEQGAGLPLVAVGPVLEANPYVILSPRRAGRLAVEINAALDALRADGTLAELEARWFGALPETGAQPVPVPLPAPP